MSRCPQVFQLENLLLPHLGRTRPSTVTTNCAPGRPGTRAHQSSPPTLLQSFLRWAIPGNQKHGRRCLLHPAWAHGAVLVSLPGPCLCGSERVTAHPPPPHTPPETLAPPDTRPTFLLHLSYLGPFPRWSLLFLNSKRFQWGARASHISWKRRVGVRQGRVTPSTALIVPSVPWEAQSPSAYLVFNPESKRN